MLLSFCCSKDFRILLELTAQCGNLIDVHGTKEAWSYVVDVVDIIETKAKVSINILLMLYLFPVVHCDSFSLFCTACTCICQIYFGNSFLYFCMHL